MAWLSITADIVSMHRTPAGVLRSETACVLRVSKLELVHTTTMAIPITQTSRILKGLGIFKATIDVLDA